MLICIFELSITIKLSRAQNSSIYGKIISEYKPIELATVFLKGTHLSATTDKDGLYEIKKNTSRNI